MPAATYTFNQFQKDYPNDEACLDKIMELRYGKEPICPACQRKAKYHRISKRRAYACQFCGEHVYPCVGTIFEKSTTPLSKWFFAMYLLGLNHLTPPGNRTILVESSDLSHGLPLHH